MDKTTATVLAATSLAVTVASKVGYDITKDAQLIAQERYKAVVDDMLTLAKQNLSNARGYNNADGEDKAKWDAETQRFKDDMEQRQVGVSAKDRLDESRRRQYEQERFLKSQKRRQGKNS